jgi:hypothetical protein
MNDPIVLLQFLFNIVFIVLVAFVLYIFLKKTIKKWTYDASYDALKKFEKDQREKDVWHRVEEVRTKYGSVKNLDNDIPKDL